MTKIFWILGGPFWRKSTNIRNHGWHQLHLFLHQKVVVPILMGTETPDRITNLDRRLEVLTHRMELIQHELNLTLNDLVREVVRLQNQVEEMRVGLDEQIGAEEGPRIRKAG
jgi:hypothetical protein